MEESIHPAERVDREVNPEVAERRSALFNKYIKPHLNLVYKLCIRYSDDPEEVEENYNICLTTLFRGIETYNPERKLLTWIHIVTKRQVYEQNRRNARVNRCNDAMVVGVDFDSMLDESTSDIMTPENYREMYSDEVLAALDSLKPMYRDALLLQLAGYTLQEIANIEYEKGTLSSLNIDTVKSRLFLARKSMREKITRDGKRQID